MTSKDSQYPGIQKDLDKMIQKEEEFRSGISLAVKRATSLSKRHLYIEELLVYSQVIEQTIRYILRGFKTIKKIETRLGMESEDYDLSDLQNDLTLSKLIKLLGKEIKGRKGSNKLLEDLNTLNTEYRIKIVHKLFDGSETNLKKVNLKVHSYLIFHGGSILKRLLEIEKEQASKAIEIINVHKQAKE